MPVELTIGGSVQYFSLTLYCISSELHETTIQTVVAAPVLFLFSSPVPSVSPAILADAFMVQNRMGKTGTCQHTFTRVISLCSCDHTATNTIWVLFIVMGPLLNQLAQSQGGEDDDDDDDAMRRRRRRQPWVEPCLTLLSYGGKNHCCCYPQCFRHSRHSRTRSLH